MAALDISPFLRQLFGCCHQWGLFAQSGRQQVKGADKMSRADRNYHKHLYQPSQEHWQCRYLPVFCGQTLLEAQQNCQDHLQSQHAPYRDFTGQMQALSITNDKMMVIFRKRKCQQGRILTTQQKLTTFPKTDKVQRQYSGGKLQ